MSSRHPATPPRGRGSTEGRRPRNRTSGSSSRRPIPADSWGRSASRRRSPAKTRRHWDGASSSTSAARQVPITDKAFAYDENLGDLAVHVAGELGSLQSEGTASMISAQLTTDEQDQRCTTGDL